MATFISHSPEETFALGEGWGREGEAGWILGLSGELGSGKTQLVKGLARGLGITRQILSPTFVIVHEYLGGRLPLAHLDLYRLETKGEILSAGLEEYLLNPAGITAVEWVERWPDFLAKPTRGSRLRHVTFMTLDEKIRSISYVDSGA